MFEGKPMKLLIMFAVLFLYIGETASSRANAPQSASGAGSTSEPPTNLARKAASSAGLQYVCSAGNDANDGLSAGSAKQHIYNALQALPGGSRGVAGQGTISICDQTAYGGPIVNQGVWLMGAGDPNYASPPSGWLKSTGGIYFGCYNAPTQGNNGHTPGCQFITGGATHVLPGIWISGFGGSAANITFDGWVNPGYLGEALRLGINSNGNRSDGTGGVVGFTFKNGQLRDNPTDPTAGPTVNIGANVYWAYFNDNVIGGNTLSGISPAADAASAVLVNAAGGTGNQLIFFEHNTLNDGSLKMYSAANGLTSIGITDIACESAVVACVWFPTGITSGDVHGVLVADPLRGSIPAIENDGGGNLSVSGGVGNNINYVGPMVINDTGGYGNFTQQQQKQSPASMGQTGTVNGHVVGKVDNVDRANPPSVVRFQNISNQNPSTVTFCAGGTITTGIDDPYGGTNALRASCINGIGQVRIYDANLSLSPGQGFVFKAWVRSHTANGYLFGKPMALGLNGAGAPTFTNGGNQVSNASYFLGTTEWQVVTGTGQISVPGTGVIDTTLWFNVDGTHSIDFYAPMFFSVPNTISTNELYEISNNLTFYPGVCTVTQVCNMEGPVFGQIITAAAGCIGCSLSGSATLTYTSITARSCQEQALAVTGAKMSEVASASPVGSLGSENLSWSARVSSADRVSVRVCNPTSESFTPRAAAWQARVIP